MYLKEKEISIKEKEIEAISYDVGIFIRIDKPGGSIEAYSEGFEEKHYILFFLVFFLSVLAVVTLSVFYLGVPVIFLLISGMVIFFVLMTWALVVEKETAEWHGAEHKLINVFITGEELTLENLKKASMFGTRCGDGNKGLKKPSEEKLKKALRLGEEIISQLNN